MLQEKTIILKEFKKHCFSRSGRESCCGKIQSHWATALLVEASQVPFAHRIVAHGQVRNLVDAYTQALKELSGTDPNLGPPGLREVSPMHACMDASRESCHHVRRS